MSRAGQDGCRLHEWVEVVEADLGAWKALEEFHYRPGRPGAVERVYALRWRAGGPPGRGAAWRGLGGAVGGREEVLGVIVYAMPLAHVALRNAATGGRYAGWRRGEGMALLNREVRRISRVVVHPRVRGVGLAARLVRETLPRAGAPLVEALAAMGRVNPFFEKAGMMRYDGPAAAHAVRLEAALEQAGIKEVWRREAGALWEAVKQLGELERRLVEQEMNRFVSACVRSGKGHGLCTPEHLAEMAVRQLLTRPVYYLWRREI